MTRPARCAAPRGGQLAAHASDRRAPMPKTCPEAYGKTPEQAMADYGGMLVKLACSRGLAKPDAEDVLQTTFLKLLESATSFSSDEHMKAWLIRVAINECNNLFRRRKRHPEAPLKSISGIVQGGACEPGESNDLLLGLREEDRALLDLAFLEGLSSAEIGEIMGITSSAVRSRLFRLRRRMEKERDEP